jgi:hypothetical protein
MDVSSFANKLRKVRFDYRVNRKVPTVFGGVLQFSCRSRFGEPTIARFVPTLATPVGLFKLKTFFSLKANNVRL